MMVSSYDFFHALYEYQNKNWSYLDKKINFILSAMAVNGSSMVYLVNFYGGFSWIILLFISSMMFFSISIGFLFYSYFLRNYVNFNEASEWFDYFEKLKEDEEFEEKFSEKVLSVMVDITDINQEINYKRGSRVVFCVRFLILSFIFSFIFGLSLVIGNL